VAAGTICASGTLGQIIPPSIVLVLLGDVLSSAYQQAQLEMGIWNPDTVSVGDLFVGALVPGFLLVALYMLYLIGIAVWRPTAVPAIPAAERARGRSTLWLQVLEVLVPPLLLIVLVLGSILGGMATPTEAAGVGAVGALMLAGYRLAPRASRPVLAGVAGFVGLLAMRWRFGSLNVLLEHPEQHLWLSLGGTLCVLGLLWGLLAALAAVLRRPQSGAESVLVEVMRQTTKVTSMVFVIFIGASLFSLVFRGFGGDEVVTGFLTDLPGGTASAVFLVMVVMFLLGFILDFIEITFVVVPIVGPVLLAMGLDPVWLGVMIAINLQTSFLTPPFGFALFYLRGVAPPQVTTAQIYRGVAPFILIQLLMLALLAWWPQLATWLPDAVYE
jgi:TRAP-type mannitol/chloroaromatic compound transport system permease large subunit